MAKLTPFPTGQELDNNGDPLSGGKVYTYEAGTTTPKTSYTDASESTANANPVILDSDGRGEIWLGEGSYYIRVYDSADNLIDERDDVIGDSSSSFLGSVESLSSNSTITTAYQNAFISCTSSPTLSLLAAADAGEGFTFAVKNDGSGVVTIDPDGAETVNGAATLSLNAGEWVILACTGSAWLTLQNKDPLSNLSASAAPTVNDDSGDGYAVGSKWYDTSSSPKEAYICLDASVGAAVWVNTTLTIDELGSAALADLIDDDTFATATDSNVPSAESVSAFVNTFLKVSASDLTGTSGYVTLNNGLIIQWFPFSYTTSNGTTSYPITFPNECFGIVCASQNLTTTGFVAIRPDVGNETTQAEHAGSTSATGYAIAVGR